MFDLAIVNKKLRHCHFGVFTTVGNFINRAAGSVYGGKARNRLKTNKYFFYRVKKRKSQADMSCKLCTVLSESFLS